jgi:hypothetical protein
MKDKTYKQRTRFLGIPVVGNNDSIWPEVELKKYQIIENLLLAGLKGMQSCIFDEGDLCLEKNPNGEFYVVLRPIGIQPALEGIVGSAYFLVTDILKWDSLVVGKRYYLYVARTVHTFSDSSSVRAILSEYEQHGKLNILVGTVDLTGDKPSLNRSPKGKVHIFDLTKHSTETENPHGSNIIQDELLIRKKLVLGDGQDTEVVVRVGNEQVTMPVVCLIPSVVAFVTSSMEGTVITSPARVGFIHTSRVSGAIGKLGEVSIGYFGQDSKVPNEQSFIVYNDGDANIPMKALIYHG